MALAILKLIAWENGNARFRMDTGTNAYYHVKMGKGVRRNGGIDWVDDVFFSTPIAKSEAGGNLLNSSQEISVPVPKFDEGKAYVQLFSCKTPQGKSPAFSRIVTMPKGYDVVPPADFALPFSMRAVMNTRPSFQPPRKIACRTHREVYAQQASLDELLAGVVKMAAPVVLDLLKGTQNGASPNASGGSASTSGNTGQANVLTQLLGFLLGSLSNGAGKALGQSQSLGSASAAANRFLALNSAPYSQPFIFGVDDALLASLAGPLLQILPQLMNATNDHQLKMEQADNKFITDILSDENRTQLLEQLLQLQQQNAGATQPTSPIAANPLIQLLQQLPATPPPTTVTQPPPVVSPSVIKPTIPPTQTVTPPAQTTLPTTLPVVAKGQSQVTPASASNLSSKVVLSFVAADPVLWNGTPRALFAQNQNVQLKIRLNVAEPVPKTPLPKAIVTLVFKKASDAAVLFEKTFKEKNILPNAEMSFRFAPEELVRLPVNTPLAVFAELRWLAAKTGKEYKAVGSTDIVLVSTSFVKSQGLAHSPMERELTDMKQFRAFWNKVWEAPTLDAASGSREDRKTRWELNANMKYSVLLSAAHKSNGLMETKILRGEVDEESTFDRTEGRMKAGIELSIAELNKLLPLWNGEQALDAEKLGAFQTEALARENAGEFLFNLKLKGRAGERGMVWVVPTFKLFEFTLNTVSATNEVGQVTAVSEERVRFPLPVSARVLGLKSE